LLSEYFLGRFSKEMDMENPGITEEAKAALCKHPWPGNVRELANTLQKALIFSRGYPLGPDDVSQIIHKKIADTRSDDQAVEETIRQWIRKTLNSSAEGNHFDILVDRFAKILIGEALNLTEGNRSRAAKLIGLSRPTLQSKIEKYQIKIKTAVKDDG